MPAFTVLLVTADQALMTTLHGAVEQVDDTTCIKAISGTEAIAAIDNDAQPLHLALVDMDLPDGFARALVTATAQTRPAVRVVAINMPDGDDGILKLLRDGAYACVPQPVDTNALIDLVRIGLSRDEPPPAGHSGLRVKSGIRGWFELTAPSDYEYVERFARFSETLARTSLSEQDREAMRLAIDEIGRNAVEWGNEKDSDKQITLSYCLFEDRIVFKVEDQGEGFNPEGVDDPSIDPLEHVMRRLGSGKRIGGYGILMTKNVMDDVIYNERGNVAILVKHLAGNK
jgi:anti-sigma regulatory factor (Ser/Thr protein kinase)